RLALQRPERWALAMALPLHWFSVLMTPFVWLLSVCTDAVVWLFRGRPGATRQEVDLEELRELIMASGGLSDDHSEVLVGAFELVDRTVEQVMTPRTDVLTVDADCPAPDAIAEMVSSGFSRLPVTEVGRGLDGAIGVVDMSDVVAAASPSTVGDLAKEAPAFPETMTVLAALRQLQAARQQMAFVIDEFGGLEGIVTIEDLVEEMVGEIYDEDDRDVASVRLEADGSYLVPGRYPMHDLKDIGIDIPLDGSSTTVAGMALDRFGRVPDVGDATEVDGWAIEVLGVEGNAVELLRFSRVIANG
ncbi:MAG: hemolysin family protein, partial [Acidimicrobiia bacterium]